jgi:glyoxylase-like metal-dependent hydrolase (beta-lactamase superfamily II)
MRVWCLQGVAVDANTYIVASDHSDAAVIIDPTRYRQLSALLHQENLRPIAILLTHGHFDHTSAVTDLLQDYPIPVYLHPGDEQMLSDPECNAFHYFFPEELFEPIEQYQAVTHQQKLCLGDLDFTVLSTPGHSEGSVCYLIDDRLFSGDTLFRGSYGRYDLWGGNRQKLMVSLERLGLLDQSIKVYPGHGESTTIYQEYFKYKRF